MFEWIITNFGYLIQLVFRMAIPVYMSHRIYTKKRDEPGAADRALKYWSLNVVLCVSDVVESIVLNNIEKMIVSYYFLYLMIKTAVCIGLFINNFFYSEIVYDQIVGKVLPSMEAHIDTLIAKMQEIAGRIFSMTPDLASSVLSQCKSLLLMAGLFFLQKIEFRAAPTEPPKRSQNSDGCYLNRSTTISEEDVLMSEIPSLDKTYSGMPGRNISPQQAKSPVQHFKEA